MNVTCLNPAHAPGLHYPQDTCTDPQPARTFLFEHPAAGSKRVVDARVFTNARELAARLLLMLADAKQIYGVDPDEVNVLVINSTDPTELEYYDTIKLIEEVLTDNSRVFNVEISDRTGRS